MLPWQSISRHSASRQVAGRSRGLYNNLNIRKSVDPFSIPSRVLEEFNKSSSIPISQIFNLSLEHGIFHKKLKLPSLSLLIRKITPMIFCVFPHQGFLFAYFTQGTFHFLFVVFRICDHPFFFVCVCLFSLERRRFM